ncbi:hypothetical protein L0P11_22560, partial [Bacteroides uniformis]|nr:hypothetical protein [Bacteroides uniformis]
MSVVSNLATVRSRIADASHRSGRAVDAVRLVLVTKTIAPARIAEAIHAGQRDLGENKVQEG